MSRVNGVVPRDLLAALAATVPVAEPPPYRQNGHGLFDLDAWLAKSGLALRAPLPWNGGRKWVADVCFWNPEHADGAAFIVQLANGAIAARCHHNGCQGKGWHDLRDVVEPGWRERHTPRQPHDEARPDRGRPPSHAPLGEGTGTEMETAAPPAPPAASRIVRAGAIALTEPDWLIDEVLPRDSLAALIGKEATLKTFAAISMAAAVHTGTPWAERDARRGPVLYLAAEGQHGIRRRLAAWEARYQGDLGDLLILPVAVNFLSEAEALTLAAEIADLPASPALIVVDTLARNMRGNENAAEDMGNFIATCDRLRRLTGAAILVIHHENKLGAYRGSTSFAAAMDTMIEAKRQERLLTLTCAKQKDGAEFAPLHLTADVVDLGLLDRKGRPLTSLVVRPADDEEVQAVKRALAMQSPISATEEHLLALLRDAPDGLTASAWQAAAETHGVSRSNFYNLRDKLALRGAIARDGEGKGARYTLPADSPISVQTGPHEGGDRFSPVQSPLGTVDWTKPTGRGPCPQCGDTRWYETSGGRWVCGTCYPPAGLPEADPWEADDVA